MVRNARELNGFPTLPSQQTARVSCDLGLRLLLRKVVSGLYFGHLTKELSNSVRNSSHFTHFSPKENTRILRQFSWGNWHFVTRTAIPFATKARAATVIWTNCSVVKPSQEETLVRPGPVAQVESVVGLGTEKRRSLNATQLLFGLILLPLRKPLGGSGRTGLSLEQGGGGEREDNEWAEPP